MVTRARYAALDLPVFGGMPPGPGGVSFGRRSEAIHAPREAATAQDARRAQGIGRRGGKQRRQVSITVSIGVDDRGNGDATPDKLRAVDRALHRAKKGERDRVPS